MAAGTGLFDQNREVWDGELLRALPVGEEQSSRISDEPARGLRGKWARRWPALAGTPWFPAVGDGVCSSVGSGCTGRDSRRLLGPRTWSRIVADALLTLEGIGIETFGAPLGETHERIPRATRSTKKPWPASENYTML